MSVWWILSLNGHFVVKNMERIKCLIAGSGPAGYTAAIYAARANLKPVIYTGLELGGQLTTTTIVENFPGFENGIDGSQLVEQMRLQAERLGAQIRTGIITKTDFSSNPLKLTIDSSTEVEADSVIIATGASAKYLGIKGEDVFRGSGVSACATCDGFFYRGKDVAVIGGGDTACEEALYLSGLCKRVYMIVRRDVMRASKVMQERVLAKENIEILWNNSPVEIVGDASGVTGIKVVEKGSGLEKVIDLFGVFLAIGHHPNSEVFAPWIDTDENGYIKTLPGTATTNVRGVFAAGDVADPIYKQAITAAASGCRAALEVEKYFQSL